jgi:glycosyltransferase involved in cell wall biosynthesis
MLTNNLAFRVKYRSRSLLDALINRYGGNGIYNLKGEKSIKDKYALVIYTAEALSKQLSGTLSEFPHMASHSGFRESIELLQLLLGMGYIVDYFDMKSPPVIDWNKYELVIDAGNNLEKSKAVRGQKKIFYATGCHWKVFYDNAYRHVDSFYRRNKILLYPDREVKPGYSDDAADVITCFGGTYQAASFGNNRHKVRQIQISTTHVPGNNFRKKIVNNDSFLWYAGYGPFHKGFDLVVEAFLRMPEKVLHIFGYIESNEKLYAWFKMVTQNRNNIHYHGWTTPDSNLFQKYVSLCDAVICASSSEGGAGAIVQCMQFGLIPIINLSTAIDLTNDKFNITGSNPEEEITSIIERVNIFRQTDSEELQSYSENLSNQYSGEHTIQKYSDSLRKVIEDSLKS